MEVKKNKILIIDDDSRNIFALKAVLNSKGYDCLAASSAAEGLEMLRQNQEIAVALLDIMMPEMDGYEALTLMKQDQTLKDTTVIAVTAHAMIGDRERCLSAGAVGYISKPVNIVELIKLLNEYL